MRLYRLLHCLTPFFIFFTNIKSTECPQVANVDFGPCMMIVGWGWNGADCIQLSGCGTTDSAGNDYSDYLFGSYDACMNTCPCIEGYVECFVDPCEVTDCPAYPNAICQADYCGGCNAIFYVSDELINGECEEIYDCPEDFEGSGDITYDMQINVLDIVMTVNIVLSGIEPTEEELCVLDLNEDGIINILDIILIIDIILNPVDTSYTINSGTSYGECWGYCLYELEQNGLDIHYEVYGWGEDPEYPTLNIDDTITIAQWQSILNSFNFEEFTLLQEVYGCPDCADGGAEWIEITHEGITKRVTFEAYDTIPNHDELVVLLRELRDYYFELVNPWGE